MATKVYTEETVELMDGREVTLRPANIKVLRLFMRKMDELKNLGEDADQFDVMDVIIDAASICLAKDFPEFYDPAENRHTEAAEEALDMDTSYKVIEIVGGTKLNDPEAIRKAEAQLAQLGQN